MNHSQLAKNAKELEQLTNQFKQSLKKIVDFFSAKMKAFVEKLQSQYYKYAAKYFI